MWYKKYWWSLNKNEKILVTGVYAGVLKSKRKKKTRRYEEKRAFERIRPGKPVAAKS